VGVFWVYAHVGDFVLDASFAHHKSFMNLTKSYALQLNTNLWISKTPPNGLCN